MICFRIKWLLPYALSSYQKSEDGGNIWPVTPQCTVEVPLQGHALNMSLNRQYHPLKHVVGTAASVHSGTALYAEVC